MGTETVNKMKKEKKDKVPRAAKIKVSKTEKGIKNIKSGWFDNLNITLKLCITIVPMVIIAVVLLIMGGVNQKKTMNESEQIYYEQLYSMNTNLSDADRDLYKALLAERDFIKDQFNTNPDLKDADIKQYEECSQSVQTNIANADKAASAIPAMYTEIKSKDGQTFKELVAKFDADFKQWQLLYDMQKGTGSYGLQVKQFDVVLANITGMKEILASYSSEETAIMNEQINKSIMVESIIVLLIITATGILSLYVGTFIKKKLVHIGKRVDIISSNDLTDDSPVSQSTDEFGKLDRAVKKMQSAILANITGIKQSAMSLEESSQKLGNSTNEASDSVANIATAVGELATTATQQAEDVEQISSRMSELLTVMEKSEACTSTLTDTSKSITSITTEGMNKVDNLTDITNQNSEAFDRIFDMIEKIGESSKKIGEASSLISSIASQTNLLSLNASIEAARAGEAGRGFAVVADEIRQLSEQSASSVGTINQMLSDLQTNTKNATEQSSLVKQYVERQDESVKETKSSFESIVSATDGVNKAVDELHSVNSELKESIDTVSSLTTSLSASSQENAATAEEINATTDAVSDNVLQLKDAGKKVEDTVDSLGSVIAEYKIS